MIIGETERLLIRELTVRDLPALRNMRGENDDPEDLGPDDMNFTEEDRLKAYIEYQYAFFGFGIWGIVLKEETCPEGEGMLIGKAGLSALPEVPESKGDYSGEENPGKTETLPGKCCFTEGNFREEDAGEEDAGEEDAGEEDAGEEDFLELSYHIAEPFRRKGYAFEACSFILEWGTEELGIRNYLCRIRKENAASLKLAQKLKKTGMQKTGMQRTEDQKTSQPSGKGCFLVRISIS